MIKMMLTGDSWMDPSTVKLFMTVKNGSADAITPHVAGARGMFRRLRILCGGQIVEDIDLYGRLHEHFHMMKPSEKIDIVLLRDLALLYQCQLIKKKWCALHR